jgi:hypothetical protein
MFSPNPSVNSRPDHTWETPSSPPVVNAALENPVAMDALHQGSVASRQDGMIGGLLGLLSSIAGLDLLGQMAAERSPQPFQGRPHKDAIPVRRLVSRLARD